MWIVYILRCCDGSLYTGITNDLELRLATHNNGKGSKYTRSKLPVVLVYRESVDSIRAALRREAAIKRLTKSKKMKLIEEYNAKDRSKE